MIGAALAAHWRRRGSVAGGAALPRRPGFSGPHLFRHDPLDAFEVFERITQLLRHEKREHWAILIRGGVVIETSIEPDIWDQFNKLRREVERSRFVTVENFTQGSILGQTSAVCEFAFAFWFVTRLFCAFAT
jgi:hypothetical protein